LIGIVARHAIEKTKAGWVARTEKRKNSLPGEIICDGVGEVRRNWMLAALIAPKSFIAATTAGAHRHSSLLNTERAYQ
jgi:hypothetical protein